MKHQYENWGSFAKCMINNISLSCTKAKSLKQGKLCTKYHRCGTHHAITVSYEEITSMSSLTINMNEQNENKWNLWYVDSPDLAAVQSPIYQATCALVDSKLVWVTHQSTLVTHISIHKLHLSLSITYTDFLRISQSLLYLSCEWLYEHLRT